ncbi:hypothetical protein [Deinococcus cellulosilyticus]|uniref:Uncharacterized protein n=1 Tax=Deinococcus cellulosilyticus (strain DSM 18568 / NBRC 106333 / KACC 11606 / 5516J-15) TaxID=1223518 RepID=A0A511MZU7_DEIC1|nr:hypothetical protein [Deinococcus cellulosilyticus]GEM45636.1 hypothetical protein DC3_12710 [Deinococcus cellulosilyticus NBRC 106333 = KACC 11606]
MHQFAKTTTAFLVTCLCLSALAQTHRLTRTQTLGEGQLEFVTSSPSGGLVAAVSPLGIRLMDGQTGKTRLWLDASDVQGATFDITDQWFGFCALHRCQLVDLRQNKVLHNIQLEGNVSPVGFLRGQLVVSGDGPPSFVDVRSGKVTRSATWAAQQLFNLCGDRGFASDEVSLYFENTRRKRVKLNLPVDPDQVFIDPSCQHLTYLHNGKLKRMNPETGEVRVLLASAPFQTGRVLDLNDTHVVYLKAGVAHLMDLATKSSTKLPFTAGYVGLQPAGVFNYTPTLLRVLDLQGKPLWKRDHTPPIHALLLDGQTLWLDVKQGPGHALASMNLTTGALKTHLNLQESAAFRMHKLGKDLYLTSNTATRFTPATGKTTVVARKVSLTPENPPVYSKVAQGKYHFRNDQGMLVAFDPASNKTLVVGNEEMKGLSVSSETTYTYNGKSELFLLHPNKNTLKKTGIRVPTAEVRDLVQDVKNHRLYAVGFNTSTLFVYDLKKAKWSTVATGTEAHTLTLSPSGQFLLLQGETTVQLWNTGKLNAATSPLTLRDLSGAALGAKEDTLYLSSQGGYVQVYRIRKS